MKSLKLTVLLTLIFSSFVYSQNSQNFIPFYNKMVDEFNSRSDFISGLQGEIQFTDGYIASNTRRFSITSSSYSKPSVDSDYEQIAWQYEKHLPKDVPAFFPTKLKEYEAAKYSSLDARAKLRDYFSKNSENIGKYRTIPKFAPALTKILAGAKPYVRALETEMNKFIAVKKELITEGRSIADRIEEENLRKAPNGEYYLALKKHLALYKGLIEWINDKKGKVLLAEYKAKMKTIKDHEKSLVAMPKIKDSSLQNRYESYLESIKYFSPLLDETIDRWEMWGNKVHPSHFSDMAQAYDRYISSYNSFVETGNRSR